MNRSLYLRFPRQEELPCSWQRALHSCARMFTHVRSGTGEEISSCVWAPRSGSVRWGGWRGGCTHDPVAHRLWEATCIWCGLPCARRGRVLPVTLRLSVKARAVHTTPSGGLPRGLQGPQNQTGLTPSDCIAGVGHGVPVPKYDSHHHFALTDC